MVLLDFLNAIKNMTRKHKKIEVLGKSKLNSIKSKTSKAIQDFLSAI